MISIGPMVNGVIKNDSETPSFALTVTVFERDESMAIRDFVMNDAVCSSVYSSISPNGHPLSL